MDFVWFGKAMLYTLLIVACVLVILSCAFILIRKIKQHIITKQVEFHRMNPVSFDVGSDSIATLCHLVKRYNSLRFSPYEQDRYLRQCIQYLSGLYSQGEIVICSEESNSDKSLFNSPEHYFGKAIVFYDKSYNYYYLCTLRHTIPVFKKITDHRIIKKYSCK